MIPTVLEVPLVLGAAGMLIAGAVGLVWSLVERRAVVVRKGTDSDQAQITFSVPFVGVLMTMLSLIALVVAALVGSGLLAVASLSAMAVGFSVAIIGLMLS